MADVDESCSGADFKVTVPNPNIPNVPDNDDVQANVGQIGDTNRLIPVDRFSSFQKLVRVTRNVLKFIQNLKQKVKERNNSMFESFTALSDTDLYASALKRIVKTDQLCNFPDIFDFLLAKKQETKNIPPLVTRLNTFIDKDGLLKVRSKFGRAEYLPDFRFPILLSND